VSDVQPQPSLSLTRVDAGLATLRTMMINIGFFAATLLLVPTMGAQIIRNPIIIEPIAVPQALADRGMTSSVAANRVWDGLQEYSRTAALARQTLVAVPDSQLVEFTLPGSTLSIDAVLKQVREFLGIQETRITGEITCQTADCAPAGQRLRLRVLRGSAEMIDMPPMGPASPSAYFHDAAGAIFDVLDPLVGAAARAVADPEGAVARAHRVASGGGPDAAWAHALMGDIALAGGEADLANEHYRSAIAIDPTLPQARLGLARANLAAGDIEAAEAQVALLPGQGDLLPQTLLLRADIALARNDLAAAEAEARAAVEADPLSPLPLIRVGQIARSTGNDEAARLAYAEALALDPGASAALSGLSELHRAAGDLAAAESLLRDWADYAPDSAEALRALVAIRVERSDTAGAAEAYARLAGVTNLTTEEVFARADLLTELDRYAEAADVLSPLALGDLPVPGAVLALARLHEQAGRTERARDFYERYLSLGPDLPERDAAEAALGALGE
jgi:tetratricopeptide (TPR) repeat protein